MKILTYFLSVIMVLGVLFSCNNKEPDDNGNTGGGGGGDSSANNVHSTVISNVRFKWEIKGDTLDASISAPTKGWVAIGFGATNAMKDANIIIGYVKNGQTTISDDFGVSSTTHKPDTQLGGTNDIIEYSGTETSDSTTLNFKIPLASSDSYDTNILTGQDNKVIVAYGANDDLTSMHSRVGEATIKF